DIPHVRLVFLLRNPVDRAYSNYLWTCKNGLETESFRRALELEAARELDLPERLRFARPYSYFSRGLYAEHLARFFALFPREQILVLRSEDVETRPQGVASAFHRFVGVAERPDDADALGRINSAVEAQTEDLDPGLREHLAQRYLRPNRDLADLLGTDFAMWP
ncbi:MAG: sulfotransferase domain-containing protein, partial [Xanthobacteraceae bacterium]